MPPETTQAARPRMHLTRHALDEDTRRSMVVILNQRLADAVDLYTQTKHAHWNVKGMDFYQLHLLFDDLAEKIEKHVDLLAERATALGGTAYGTVRMTAGLTRLPEVPTETTSGRELVEALVDSYATHARGVGDAITRAEEAADKATADLLTQLAREIDMALYFLESHVQGKGR